jgi:hypothetical protein
MKLTLKSNYQAQNGYTSKDYYFEQSPNDKNLFIAGEGLVSNMKIHTVDGYSYAIPLFNIIRLNNSGYDKLNNPNGAIDYVDKDSISDRPDGKFSNIIYSDQIYDLRHLSALGETQFDKIYTKLSKYIDDNVILKNKIIRLTSDIQHTNHILKNLGYTLPGIHDKDLYGIEMYHQYCQTSGGVLDNATMQVIYKKHKCYLSDALVSKNYGVIPTLIDYNYDEIGELGDLYIQKNTSYFNVYNTGAKNLTLDVTAVEVDNSIIYSGEGTFNGMDGTFITLGFNVDTEKHFIYICPLENSNGRNGEIFIKAIDNQFIVYNTGITTDKSGNLANTTGNKFQWILIDLQSTNMKNINAYNINLNGQKGYTLTHNSFGENYRLLVSTPIFTTADTIEEGSIGDIYADTEEDNQCIIYNTGKMGINVNCLIFNDVKYDEYYDILSFVSQNSIPTIVQY